MGQAKITGGGPTGLYDITLVKHAGKSVARLKAIAARLTKLTTLIFAATTAVETALTALTTAQETLNKSISYTRTTTPSLTAVPRWHNYGNGTCNKISPGPSCQIGLYTLTFGATIPGNPSHSPPIPDSLGFYIGDPFVIYYAVTAVGHHSDAQLTFTTAQGSLPFEAGDIFDIEVTAATQKPVTSVTAATKAVLEAQATLTTKRRDLSLLTIEKTSLLKEQTRLQAAMATEAKTGIWCTDLTENLVVGATVGTMEMNGVDDQIILAPGGSVAKSIGLLQHVGVSSPSAVFLNKARLPGWQKWKPTHRVGTITAIDYATDKCDVGIEAKYSEEQGLPINQAGAAYTAIKMAVAGWSAFAAANPTFPLVANTANSILTVTPQLTADLASVNSYVNSRFNYQLDTTQYGKLDNWALMAEGGKGDCEDFALTKAKKLLDLGYAASALHIEVGTLKGQGHAWLVVQTDKGDIALDNRYVNPMPNGSTPYIERRRQTGTTWSAAGVQLSSVPIEYMSGMNSGPFVVGDNVVVQFTGQAWTAPKVVGFETNPRILTGTHLFYRNGTTLMMAVCRISGNTVAIGKRVTAASVGITEAVAGSQVFCHSKRFYQNVTVDGVVTSRELYFIVTSLNFNTDEFSGGAVNEGYWGQTWWYIYDPLTKKFHRLSNSLVRMPWSRNTGLVRGIVVPKMTAINFGINYIYFYDENDGKAKAVQYTQTSSSPVTFALSTAHSVSGESPLAIDRQGWFYHRTPGWTVGIVCYNVLDYSGLYGYGPQGWIVDDGDESTTGCDAALSEAIPYSPDGYYDFLWITQTTRYSIKWRAGSMHGLGDLIYAIDNTTLTTLPPGHRILNRTGTWGPQGTFTELLNEDRYFVSPLGALLMKDSTHSFKEIFTRIYSAFYILTLPPWFPFSETQGWSLTETRGLETPYGEIIADWTANTGFGLPDDPHYDSLFFPWFHLQDKDLVAHGFISLKYLGVPPVASQSRYAYGTGRIESVMATAAGVPVSALEGLFFAPGT